MNKSHLIVLILVLFTFAANLRADESPKGDGFVTLFNGVDLKGWVGNTDGYKAADGVLVCQAGKSKGGKIYTAKEYADFIFQFEFSSNCIEADFIDSLIFLFSQKNQNYLVFQTV